MDKEKYNELRKKAIRSLRGENIGNPDYNDFHKNLEVINIQKIELEMQNDELINSNNELNRIKNEFTAFFDTSPIGLLILDTDFIIKKSNNTALSLLGVHLNEVIGKSFEHFISKEYQDTYYFLKQELPEKGKLTKKLELLNPIVGAKYVLTEINTFNFKTNDVTGDNFYQAALIDISENKRIEEEKQQIGERLNKTLDAVDIAWWEFDFTNDSVVYSDKKATNLGYTTDEFPDTSVEIMRLVHPDDYEKTMQSMRDYIMGKNPLYETEYRIKAKDGSYRWYYDKGSISQRLPDGRPKKLIGTTLDITSRKRAEEALIISKNLYQSLISSQTNYLTRIDLEGNYTYANQRFYDKFGFSSEEVIGKPFGITVYQDDIELCNQAAYECIMNPGKIIPITIRKPNPQGGLFWTDWEFICITDENGNPREIQCVGIDVTARIEAENAQAQLVKELEDSQTKLKEALAAKDKFFSIIAHDLRSPFSIFLNLSESLANESNRLTLEEMQVTSKTLNESANSVYKLLNDLLLWSRAQIGNISFKPYELDLYEIAFETIYTLNSLAQKKSIEIINKIELDTIVFADRNMLSTVLRNLVSNSIKFSNLNGRVEIGINANNTNNDFIEVYVKDNGIGIAPENIEKLFRIDEHFTTSGTKNEIGSGLGLILCYDFVKIHGGEINVSSTPNEGSTFIFTIPKHQIDS